VIAGSAKGRRLSSPRGLDTRPMTSRAREALFSSLGDAVGGARVLDLFAGAGSLGIEALSRGAASATFVEKAKPALESLRANLDATGFAADVIAGDVTLVVPRLDGDFDLVFVDPPFELESSAVAAVLAGVVAVTAAAASVVLHRRAGEPAVPVPPLLTAHGGRRYGDSVLWRYTRN
jgi:16S rRNA (guanine966-N2)-methyltransferase